MASAPLLPHAKPPSREDFLVGEFNEFNEGIRAPVARNAEAPLSIILYPLCRSRSERKRGSLSKLRATRALPTAGEQVVDQDGDVGDVHAAILVAVGRTDVDS